ncbi:MAG: hypothetical protein A3I61_16900 [Acidobacteria bacterium RIFCSPLOWO2_02_FULL_68_18]|nr:MAG: hypothetical protein A3I61_16900 [Acidobacteria bacterium RIFCSPLOWO2_02_FULL_68_18]OFW50133.1 MAG: hypothetical protein A3G77_09275 [Acidobacteria bacterium RIFCSPLOWO2_12_FULL_68_19]
MIALVCFSPAASAQWVNYPTAGVPRLPDGTPNLSAPAPRAADGKPDFSGMWQAAHVLPCNDVTLICTDLPISEQFRNIGAGVPGGLPYQPWARERMARRGPADDPYTRCLTPGGPRMHLLPTMKKIVQLPALMIVLNEYNTNYRQIFLDGRPLPVDPNPTWNGYSSGRWEGDTLVVESIGFRDDQWLDAASSPLTSAATVTERFRRPDFGHLWIEITVADPKAYTRTWTVTLEQAIVVDTEMLDANCWENEKDVPRLLGR